MSDEGDNIIILNYIFNKNRYGQYELIIYCRKIIINELFDKLLVYGNL